MIFTSDECVICLAAQADTLFMPCSHQCTCGACSDAVRKANLYCPLCRQTIATASAVVAGGGKQ